MGEKQVKNLVICSTLNQITNYIIIKLIKEKYNLKKVYNITFKKEAIKAFNFNIKPREWDKQLKNKCKNIAFQDVEFDEKEIRNLKKIEIKLKNKIFNKIPQNEEIYWHVTGGQRTIALAISELIKAKEREKDRLIYIEGNTEKLIINDYNGELVSADETYGYSELTFETALRLVGFNTKNLDSTTIFKGKENLYDKKEYQFYKQLYNIVRLEEKDKKSYTVKFIDKDKNQKCDKDCFRDLLLKSNSIKNNKKETQRQNFVRNLFEELLEKNKPLQKIGYYQEKKINKDNEFNKYYPAGYIFEKLVAYKIYDLVKNDPKIIGMETSLKTYFNKEEKDKSQNENLDKDNIIDEIDIILLTDTGKIINFECKSGGMTGDNAKSTKYTTYRLAGVFGMPILVSPLYAEEIDRLTKNKNEYKDEYNKLKNQLKAVYEAQTAELEVIPIDKIEEKLDKLGIIKRK